MLLLNIIDLLILANLLVFNEPIYFILLFIQFTNINDILLIIKFYNRFIYNFNNISLLVINFDFYDTEYSFSLNLIVFLIVFLLILICLILN
jgi:hypothetical protein